MLIVTLADARLEKACVASDGGDMHVDSSQGDAACASHLPNWPPPEKFACVDRLAPGGVCFLKSLPRKPPWRVRFGQRNTANSKGKDARAG